MTFGAAAQAQAVFTPADSLLRIPLLSIGADSYKNVIFRLDPDGRLSLVGADPAAPAGQEQTLQLTTKGSAKSRCAATCRKQASP
ncbi:MAG: hypothetical protein CFE44_01785 [Burkholderiales bacterium PBB4]|nr:MAG: hypothetical protein CFE44_01785 [Burkholderiales bacterium PBB4]